ncbi:MAG: hypothetical protein WC792_01410 [Candidatus Micrarchaeia archaeon]|jgi:hypothetical protein
MAGTPIANTIAKGAAIAIAAILLLFIASQIYKPQPAPIATPTPAAQATATPVPSFVEVSGIEAAQSALAFINGMKLSDGTYVYSVDCDSSGCNKKSNLTGLPQSNAWAALANVGLYRATKDSKYLDAAKAEVAKEIAACPVSTPIPGQKLEKNCLWALVQPYEVYKETKDAATKKFILDTSGVIAGYLGPTPRDGPMLESIIARELAIAYSLSKDEKYLQLAIKFNDAAKTALDAKNETAYANGFPVRLEECWQKLAELQLYDATQNQSYLSSAKGFFDGIEKAGASDSFYENFESANQLHPCAESLQILAGKTGDAKYSAVSAAISAHLAQASWDSQYSKKYGGGNGGFVTTFCQQNNAAAVCAPANVKTVTDNAYSAYLLSSQGGTLRISKTSSMGVGKLNFNVSRPPATEAPTPVANWTHFDGLGVLDAKKASDSPTTFYVTYFADINAPLSNAAISVDGEKFPFENAPSCFTLAVMKGACTRTYADRSEIQYVLTYDKAAAGKTYSIELSGSGITQKKEYLHS